MQNILTLQGNIILAGNKLLVKSLPVSPPNAPTSANVSIITSSSATVNWTAPSSGDLPAEYAIFLNSVEIGTIVYPATSYDLSALSAETNYDVYVLARNAGGDSSPSNTVNFDTLAATLSLEWQDLIAVYGEVEAQNKMNARYGTAPQPHPISFSAYRALFTNIGDTFRDPTFGTLIRYADDQLTNINGERCQQNADGSKWFFNTPPSGSYQLFDTLGFKIGGDRDLTFEGKNPTDSVRWHPVNPDILFYIIDDHIMYYDTSDTPPAQNPYIAATSPHGALGDGNHRRLAGGDGNIGVAVEVSPGVFEARILISHGNKNEKIQILVLDTWEVVRHSWTGATTIEVKFPWDISSPHFDFPNPNGTSDFDYGTLTLVNDSGNQLIMTAIDTMGTRLWDFNGTLIEQFDSSANHMNQILYTEAGVNKIGTTKKTVTNMLSPFSEADDVGDALAWYFDVNMDTNPITVTKHSKELMDWGDGHHQSGGGLYSSYSPVTKTCLWAMNSAADEGANVPFDSRYYSEITELDCTDAGDVARRLLHHMIHLFNLTGQQPEVWLSKDGTHGFFKTDVGDEISGDGALFWFQILPRTPIGQR